MRPGVSEAMLVLNSLPDSIKGCLLEAARLCGSTADIAQRNVLHQWHLRVRLCAIGILHPATAHLSGVFLEV